MMRISHCFWMTSFVLALLGGCGSDSSTGGQETPSDEVEKDDVEGKADGQSLPIGTYWAESAPKTFGEPALLVLKTDKSFHLVELPLCPSGDGCNTNTQAVDGTYKLTKTSSSRYVTLKDATGRKIHRFAYKLQSGKLMLREDPLRGWYVLPSASEPWCDSDQDCSLQNLKCPSGKSLCAHSVCGCNIARECTYGDDTTCPEGQACAPGYCKAFCPPDLPPSSCCTPDVCVPTPECTPGNDQTCPEGQTCVPGYCKAFCPEGMDCCSPNICKAKDNPKGCTYGDDSTCPEGETCVPGWCPAFCPEGENCCKPNSCVPAGQCDPSPDAPATCPDGQTCIPGYCKAFCPEGTPPSSCCTPNVCKAIDATME